MNKLFIFSLILSLAPGLSRAEDICETHPDLCIAESLDGAPAEAKKKKTKPKTQPLKMSRKKKFEKCRESAMDLFACEDAAAAAQDMIEEELSEDPNFGSKEPRETPPDESYVDKPRRHDLDVDSYVHLNAANPFLKMKNQNAQQAFVEPKRKPASVVTPEPISATSPSSGADDTPVNEGKPTDAAGK